MRYLMRAAINAVGLWLCTILVPGIGLTAHAAPAAGTTVVYLLIIGAIMGLVNFFVRPVVKFFSLPFYLVTCGLFFLVVNAFMLMLTANLTSGLNVSLDVATFGSAFWGGIVLSIVNTVMTAALPSPEQR